MADFEIRIIYNNISRLSEEASRRAAAAVRKAAYDVEGHAKAVVPVDTGNLKNSISSEFPSDLTALVAPHTEYAIYVEYGTVRMRARPYMRPAAEAVRPGFIKAMEAICE